MRRPCLTAIAIVAALGAAAPEAASGPLVERPIVIAHRGASGYLPEHTVEAYRLGIRQGADFIEPDLFLTRDRRLVALHDDTLNATTNIVEVAAEKGWTDRARIVGGVPRYYVFDFDLDEIRQLTARSRGTAGYSRPGNGFYDGSEPFKVATFTEVLEIAHQHYRETGQLVGVYPELKFTQALGPAGGIAYLTAMADALLAELSDPRWEGLFDRREAVFIQSFIPAALQYLRPKTKLPLVALTFTLPDGTGFPPVPTCPATLEAAQALRAFADGIGVNAPAATEACIRTAQEAGLLVHVYTLTDDPEAYRLFFGRGVDGVFSNHPDVGVRVRDELFPVPEPAAAALFGVALLALGAARRASA